MTICISATLRRSVSNPSTTPRILRSIVTIQATRSTIATASTMSPKVTSANGDVMNSANYMHLGK